MNLKKLIQDINPLEIKGELEKKIDNIVYDSRQVKAGSLFLAIRGFTLDGHDFIDKAIKNGAIAIVIEKELKEYKKDITYIKVKDSREAMAHIAAVFYNYPLEELDLIGITGTNGKTTTTYLIKNMLDNIGMEAGLIGTIKNIIGDKVLPATRTTPESLDLYTLFDKMYQANLKRVVMEVSSHALDLKRVIGMKFKVAIFTNISQDHLDYHKTISAYLKAKSKLFTQLKNDGFAVVNIDDKHSDKIIKASVSDVLTYSINKDSDFKAYNIDLSPRGVSFSIQGKMNFDIKMKITGLFNVYNTLAAIACGYALGLKERQIKEGLERVTGVAGRFEAIKEAREFSVIVDYAHTPDGMENVLKTALEFVKGKIIVVFGCGGDRDKGKRPQMAEMAAKYGDYVIITSDNPRSEEPIDIIQDIEKGIENTDTEYKKIIDRKEAIHAAIKQARKDDMLIIFGKGHETYQVFKDKTIAFDDRQVAREALEELYGDK
ncbi:MAG: UDP-N-acetylmuramoyl-L-alanyl-D-glutamate--2,6-diaminopimelate ligase [bacterium]